MKLFAFGKSFMAWILVVVLSVSLFTACTKDEDLGPEMVYPLNPGGYLVSGENLGSISKVLIRSAMEAAGYPEFQSYVEYSIRVYKLIYRTTFKGEQINVSGLLIYPSDMNEPMPTMIIGNGLTFANRDAPTSFALPDNFTGFEFFATLGYLTLIPDMIGFGESKEFLFPIHNYQYSAQTMIDYIYAVEEFVEAKQLDVSETTYLTGYSQGAHVALSTLKMIEEKPIPDIEIRATCVGAGGYNLVYILDDAIEKNTYTLPSHLIFLFYSYNDLYGWDRPMTDFFQEPYAGRIPRLLNGEYDAYQIADELAYSFDSLLNPDFVYDIKNDDEPDVISAFAANSIDDWAPIGRLHLIHSINDDRISYLDTQNTYDKMLANGADSVTCEYYDMPGHVNAALGFVQMSLEWFDELDNK